MRTPRPGPALASLAARSRRALILAVASLLVGCSDYPLPIESAPERTSSGRTVPPFPPLASPGVVYEGPPDLYAFAAAYHGAAPHTRFVIHDRGTFSLQFASPNHGILEFGGTWEREGNVYHFAWNGWSTAGPWLASGVLVGTHLSLRYNTVMMLSDFADGVYVRVP